MRLVFSLFEIIDHYNNYHIFKEGDRTERSPGTNHVKQGSLRLTFTCQG